MQRTLQKGKQNQTDRRMYFHFFIDLRSQSAARRLIQLMTQSPAGIQLMFQVPARLMTQAPARQMTQAPARIQLRHLCTPR